MVFIVLVHLTTKLHDRFTALLMLSVHVWSCCTCPLCTIDQALVKLVTKAYSYPSRINHSIDPVVINKGNDKHLAPPLMESTESCWQRPSIGHT